MDEAPPERRADSSIRYYGAVISGYRSAVISFKEAGEKLMRGHYYPELMAEGTLTP